MASSYNKRAQLKKPSGANPELNVGNCLKSSKMDKKKQTYIVLYQVAKIFKKIEIFVAHETHFKHVFKLQEGGGGGGGAKSILVG